MIGRAIPWTRQPQYAARLAKAPLTAGIVYARNFASANIDVARNDFGAVTDSGTVSLSLGGGGMGLKNSNSIRYYAQGTDAANLTSGGVTHLLQAKITSVDANFGGVVTVADSSTNSSFSLQRQSTTNDITVYRSNTNGSTITGVVSSIADSEVNTIVATSRGHNGFTSDIWKNGVLLGTGTTNGTGTQASGAPRVIYFGERNVNVAFGSDGEIYLHIIWNRVLTDAEIVYLGRNPWKVFQPIQRRIWAPAAVGGSTSPYYAYNQMMAA